MVRRALPNFTRRGAVLPLTAILMIVLLAMVAFAVDIGYLKVARNGAQNAADAASLAGMGKLAERLKSAPIVAGIPVQTEADLQLARDEVKAFALRNRVAGQDADVHDADIAFGYMANPYDHSNDTLDTSGWPTRPYNAVRVTVRRDANHAGGPVKLFFAPVLGAEQVNISASATAAFTMGTVTPRGNQGSYRGGLLPFAYQVDEWNAFFAATTPGQVTAANGVTFTVSDNFTVDPQSAGPGGVSSRPDGKLETKLFPDRTTAGNFGTINFSRTGVGNSTNVIRDLIVNGPAEADWPDLSQIVTASPGNPIDVNGETGISAGMEPAVQAIVGESHFIPLYSVVYGQGNNTFFRIVGFAPVTIVEVDLGDGNKHITMQTRVIAQRSVIGRHRIFFDIAPGPNPNPMFLGSRALVR